MYQIRVNETERCLVTAFRELSEEDRAVVLRLATSLALEVLASMPENVIPLFQVLA